MEKISPENSNSSPSVHVQEEQKKSGFQPLFNHLSHVIDVSREKFDLHRTNNHDRQKWARLLITGCEAYAKLLESSKIDEIEERLTKLEEGKNHI
jgi:hypothetical protein